MHKQFCHHPRVIISVKLTTHALFTHLLHGQGPAGLRQWSPGVHVYSCRGSWAPGSMFTNDAAVGPRGPGLLLTRQLGPGVQAYPWRRSWASGSRFTPDAAVGPRGPGLPLTPQLGPGAQVYPRRGSWAPGSKFDPDAAWAVRSWVKVYPWRFIAIGPNSEQEITIKNINSRNYKKKAIQVQYIYL